MSVVGKVVGILLFLLSSTLIVYIVCCKYFLPAWDMPRLFRDDRTQLVMVAAQLVSPAVLVASVLLIRDVAWILGTLAVAGVIGALVRHYILKSHPL